MAYAQQGASITYDPRTFGCPWDGVHDDLPGFMAMQAAISSAADNHNARVELPLGFGYFSDDLHLKRSMRITGHGGGSNPGSGFQFAPGKGVICEDHSTSDDGGSFDGGLIEHVAVFGTQLVKGNASYGFLGGIRAPSTFYEVGQGVHDHVYDPKDAPPLANLFFRVTKAGTTSSGDGGDGKNPGPAAWPTTIGNTVADGSVVWTAEAVVEDYKSDHDYLRGQRVQMIGDLRYYWECTQSGRSSTIPNRSPAFKPGGGGVLLFSTITDNTVKWVTKVHAGYLVRVMCTLSHYKLQGFTCAGIHAQSDPPTGVDFFYADNGQIYHCGLGVVTSGSDAQGGRISNLNTINLGTSGDGATSRTILDARLGAGGIMIYENGQGGNLWESCYAQNGHGPAIYMPVGHEATFVSCGSENGYLDIILAPAVVLQRGNQDYAVESDALIITTAGGQGIVERDRHQVKTLNAGITRQDGFTVHWFNAPPDDSLGNQYLGWRYQASANQGKTGIGWWGLGFGSQNIRYPVGISSTTSAEGPGNWREYLGKYLGTNEEGALFNGITEYAFTDKQASGGVQPVGSKWAFKSHAISGTYEQYVVTVQGMRGRRWTAGFPQTGVYPDWAINADLVEPRANAYPLPAPGSKVFRVFGGLLIGGRSGAAASITASVLAYTGRLVTLTGLSGMSGADVSRTLCVTNAATGANNGGFLILAVHSPTSVDVFDPAAAVAPDGNNGSIHWQVYDAPGSTGSSEPNWAAATVIGDLIADNAGGGNVTWILAGFTPTYGARGQFIDDPVAAIIPQTRVHWRDTTGTDPGTAAPKAKVDSYRENLQTITNSANQVLLTTDDLADNSCSIVDVKIMGKKNGNFKDWVSAKLSATYGRNTGGAPADVPTDDNVVKNTAGLAGTTFSFAVNGNRVQIRVTPGANVTIDWGIVVRVSAGNT